MKSMLWKPGFFSANNMKRQPINRYIDIVVFLFLAVFPLLVTPYRIEFMSKVLVYIIFALSIDLLWGYTGLMSFGHAVLFGLGGYVTALSYTLIKGLPLQAGFTQVPPLLAPLMSPIVAFILALLVPGLIAAVIGVFIFSSKISGVFFSLITLAFAYIFELFVTNVATPYTNGSNGLGGLPRSILGSPNIPSNTLYYILLGAVLLTYFFCLWLTHTRFGAVLKAIRENEPRLTFLGYRPDRFKTAIFVISGMIAGFAGVLYIPTVKIISPVDVGITVSTLLLVWVAIGGRGNLTGAIVGTILINWAKTLLSELSAELWLLIVGLIVLIIVFFMPMGLIGKLIDIQYNRRHSRSKNAALEEEANQ